LFFSFYQTESFNVQPRYDCIETQNGVRTSTKYNNQVNCTANGGKWLLLYSYLEKAPGTNRFSKQNMRFFVFHLGYTTQSACEQASSSRYQYKWARKYPMCFFDK